MPSQRPTTRGEPTPRAGKPLRAGTTTYPSIGLLNPSTTQSLSGPAPGRIAAGAAIFACACALTACGSSGENRDVRIETVEPAAFRAAPGEPGAVRPLAAAPAPAVDPDPAGDATPARSPESFRIVPGDGVLLADPGQPVEEPQLLDAKVGDINGRPVFVSEFLGPIEGRLRAEANRLNRDAWMRTTAGIIQREMRALITDELLKAEALSKLSVEQKAGLRRFLDDVRRNLLSENRGSQQLAEARLRREQGVSQEEFLKEREDRTLVRFTLQEDIQDRITVSWRDIVQRYARDESRYNPEPIARFYIVRVSAADESAIAEVTARIESGEAFPDIAASEINTWTLDEFGLREIGVPGTLAEAELFGVPELNDPATALGIGETTAAISFGSSILWLHLDSIEQDSISLYDAQLPISQQILSERTADELERYIDRLLGRASVSDVEDMMVRLLEIAAERYGPEPGARRAPGRR